MAIDYEDRRARLVTWLCRVLDDPAIHLEPASADASFRRYFRVHSNGRTLIAMDAPPPHEDCRPFVAVAGLFRDSGVNTPEILASDIDQGYLLLTDFGTVSYLDALDADSADALYRTAMEALVRVQGASRLGVLPEYDRALLQREMQLFPEWYVARHLGVELMAAERAGLKAVFEQLLAANLAEGQVFVHRDYHSRNLMVTEPNPGILDFQDAVHGPISYDLVSLLRDAYVEWPEERVLDWAIRYWEMARARSLPVPADFARFYRNFEWMGAQRQIKVLGIFARLKHRDGKDRYLADMPRVRGYLARCAARYRELAPLARLLERIEGAGAGVAYSF